MNQLAKDVGKRIRELRTKKSLTQEVLADRTGLTTKFISEVECGKTNPSLRTLEKISGVLKVGLPDLFTQVPRPKVRTTRHEEMVEELSRLIKGKSPQKVEFIIKALKGAMR